MEYCQPTLIKAPLHISLNYQQNVSFQMTTKIRPFCNYAYSTITPDLEQSVSLAR